MAASNLMRVVTASLTGLMLTSVAPVAVAADPGQGVYEQTCVACHGADGKGVLPGVPDLTEKGGRLSQSEDVLVRHVIDGFQSPGSPMAMPPNGGNANLTEAEARAVVKYLLGAFGSR